MAVSINLNLHILKFLTQKFIHFEGHRLA